MIRVFKIGYKDNLQFEQEKKHEFQECLEKFNDNLSLSEELSLEKIQSKIPCELCGKGFVVENDVKIHIEMIHKKLLRQQKYILMSSLSNLQENYIKRKNVCLCAGVCRINNNIHN